MKSEVYRWRVRPEIKAALQREARRARTSIGKLLDDIVKAGLGARDRGAGAETRSEARARAAAMSCFGTVAGGDATRSEQIRSALRQRLRVRRVVS